MGPSGKWQTAEHRSSSVVGTWSRLGPTRCITSAQNCTLSSSIDFVCRNCEWEIKLWTPGTTSFFALEVNIGCRVQLCLVEGHLVLYLLGYAHFHQWCRYSRASKLSQRQSVMLSSFLDINVIFGTRLTSCRLRKSINYIYIYIL
jgi:hypothetical protein